MPFTFLIGGDKHIVTRAGLAQMNNEPVLMICGLHRNHIKEDKRDEFDALRFVERPTEFEGIRVDVLGDD